MLSAKWLPFCPGVDDLKYDGTEDVLDANTSSNNKWNKIRNDNPAVTKG